MLWGPIRMPATASQRYALAWRRRLRLFGYYFSGRPVGGNFCSRFISQTFPQLFGNSEMGGQEHHSASKKAVERAFICTSETAVNMCLLSR